MNIFAICATKGRHTCLERTVGMFLQQDYKGSHTMLIFNNSPIDQVLHLPDNLPKNKKVILLNHSRNKVTHQKYLTLGEIYNDALTYIPSDCQVLTHWDDDDLFLNNHISEGIKGLERAKKLGKIAYKPEKSYYRHVDGVAKMANTLEPSIFVQAQHIKNYGYSLTTTEQHLEWVTPLISSNMILVDPKGISTLIYNWGDFNIPTFKTSGDYKNPENFNNYERASNDHGDMIVTPWKPDRLQEYYKQVLEHNDKYPT